MNARSRAAGIAWLLAGAAGAAELTLPCAGPVGRPVAGHRGCG